MLSSSLQNIPNGNQSTITNITNSNYTNYDIRQISNSNTNMTSSTFARDIDKDVAAYVVNSQTIPHRNLYNTQYINLTTKLENCYETGSRSGLEHISNSDLLSNSNYMKSELVNSEDSSSESLASSRDASQIWGQEKTVHKMLPDDQVILPKKGQKQDKEDIFKKLTSRDCL